MIILKGKFKLTKRLLVYLVIIIVLYKVLNYLNLNYYYLYLLLKFCG